MTHCDAVVPMPAMTGPQDTIRLTGLSARGYHGVYDSERAEGQIFIADVTVRLGQMGTDAAAASDALEDAVDYSAVANAVVGVLEGEPVALLETLAARIATAALGFAGVREVEVTVHKPQAPLEVAFEDVSVTITRSAASSGQVRPAAAGGEPGSFTSIFGQVAEADAAAGLRPQAPLQADASGDDLPRDAGLLAGAASAAAAAGLSGVVGAAGGGAEAASAGAAGLMADQESGEGMAEGTEDTVVPAWYALSDSADGSGAGALPAESGDASEAGDPAEPADVVATANVAELGQAEESVGQAVEPDPAEVPSGGPDLPEPGSPQAQPETVQAETDQPGLADEQPAPFEPTGAEPAVLVDPATAISPLDRRPERAASAVIALGGNVGGVVSALRTAIHRLSTAEGVRVTDVAPLARTAPVLPDGAEPQPDYLNTVVLVETTLSPREVLGVCQALEREAGRVRVSPKGPRTLDADLVVYEGVTSQEEDLILPHPRARERAFVLVPWAQANPFAEIGEESVAALAESAPDRDGLRWLALDWLDSDHLPALPTGQYVAPPLPPQPIQESDRGGAADHAEAAAGATPAVVGESAAAHVATAGALSIFDDPEAGGEGAAAEPEAQEGETVGQAEAGAQPSDHQAAEAETTSAPDPHIDAVPASPDPQGEPAPPSGTPAADPASDAAAELGDSDRVEEVAGREAAAQLAGRHPAPEAVHADAGPGELSQGPSGQTGPVASEDRREPDSATPTEAELAAGEAEAGAGEEVSRPDVPGETDAAGTIPVAEVAEPAEASDGVGPEGRDKPSLALPEADDREWAAPPSWGDVMGGMGDASGTTGTAGADRADTSGR